MLSLIYTWMNGWVHNREADDLRRHRTHYAVTVMGSVVGVGIMSLVLHMWSFACNEVRAVGRDIFAVKNFSRIHKMLCHKGGVVMIMSGPFFTCSHLCGDAINNDNGVGVTDPAALVFSFINLLNFYKDTSVISSKILSIATTKNRLKWSSSTQT